MVSVKRIVLDVLKPHQPNALEFCQAIAKVGVDYHVRLIVLEVDENTETLQIAVEGNAVDFEVFVHTKLFIPLSLKRNKGNPKNVSDVEFVMFIFFDQYQLLVHVWSSNWNYHSATGF